MTTLIKEKRKVSPNTPIKKASKIGDPIIFDTSWHLEVIAEREAMKNKRYLSHEQVLARLDNL